MYMYMYMYIYNINYITYNMNIIYYI